MLRSRSVPVPGHSNRTYQAARYFLTLAARCAGFKMPAPDAWHVLGERQFGYSTLVEKFLGVKLEKGPQKANWALRPLTERMEQYARNDTHYLKPLADKLRAGLEAKGRLAWHQESCARLIEDCTQPRPADLDSIWRVKGCHLLGRSALAILREL